MIYSREAMRTTIMYHSVMVMINSTTRQNWILIGQKRLGRLVPRAGVVRRRVRLLQQNKAGEDNTSYAEHG